MAIAPAEVEGAFTEGIGFDGSAIEGLSRTFESDLLAYPDPTTFQTLPWRGDIDPTARMFCDITTPDGEPAVADPRNVLKRTLARAADRGFTFYTHPEIEFYLLKSSKYGAEGPQPVDSAGYFDNVPGGTAHDFRRRSVRMLEDLGISVEFSHHEAGPGQNEIDLRYADALTTADNIMTFRTVDQRGRDRAGRLRDLHAEAVLALPGQRHAHPPLALRGRRERLLRAGRAVPALEDRPPVHRGPAAPRQRDLGGHEPVRQLVQAALWGGDEAPSFICWGHNNRSALVRVPLYKPNKGQSARVEYRAIDSAANPYLAFSLLLAAGMKGIEEGYELPPEAEDDVWALTDSERRALGYHPLPASLDHAIEYMEESELVAETLGEQVFNYVLANKRAEWRDYRSQVTPFELHRNLEIL